MKGFSEIIKLEFKGCMQYKFAFMITILTQPLMLFINMALFTSIFQFNGATEIVGYNLGQLIWYNTCTGFIWTIVFTYTDYEISHRIVTGELGIDLLRPMSLLDYHFARAIGFRLTALLTELLPGILIYSLIYFPYFMTPLSVLKFIGSVTLSFMIMYMVSFLTGLVAFVLKRNDSIIGIKAFLINMLGGCFIPLDFFPPGIQSILAFLPFEYIFYWPTQFLLNTKLSQGTDTFLRIIGVQALMIVILYAACKFFWKRAAKRFCAVG